MKIKRISNQNGITILEVLIAMIILSMSLLVLLNMAMVALDGNDWSNKTTMATQLMQEKLEQLRADESILGTGSDVVDGVSRGWNVTTITSHLRRVNVNVTWSDVRGRIHADTVVQLVNTDAL